MAFGYSHEPLDAMLSDVAQRAGGIEPLLESFFGFLHRRTDFYDEYIPAQGIHFERGFPVGHAETLLMKAFRKFDKKRLNVPVGAPVSALTDRNSTDCRIEASSATQHRQISSDSGSIGNGGFGPNYRWSQLYGEITLTVDVANGTRTKDVEFIIKQQSLILRVCNVTLLDGILESRVNASDAVWTLESVSVSQPQIVIHLDKIEPAWWVSVFQGHPQIDTSQVKSP